MLLNPKIVCMSGLACTVCIAVVMHCPWYLQLSYEIKLLAMIGLRCLTLMVRVRSLFIRPVKSHTFCVFAVDVILCSVRCAVCSPCVSSEPVVLDRCFIIIIVVVTWCLTSNSCLRVYDNCSFNWQLTLAVNTVVTWVTIFFQ